MNFTALVVLTMVVLLLVTWFLLLPYGPKDDPWAYPDLQRWDEHSGH